MIKVVVDPAGIAMIGRSTELLAAVQQVGEAVAENARSIAKSEAYLTGDYHDGIDVDSGVDGNIAIARVNANDWKSGFVEYGTVHNAAHHPLTRAAEAEGLELHG